MRLLLVPQKNGDNLNSLRWWNDCVWKTQKGFCVDGRRGSEGCFLTRLTKTIWVSFKVWLPRETEFVPSPIEVLILEVENAHSRRHSEFHWVRRV